MVERESRRIIVCSPVTSIRRLFFPPLSLSGVAVGEDNF